MQRGTDTATAEANPKRWRALYSISIPLIMVGIDSTILNVALPDIAKALHTTSSELEWINSAYIIIYGSTILLSGTLADKFGRKRFLLLGMVIFIIGSIWCGVSTSPNLLIVGRLIQGVGGGMLTPATLSLITNIFTEKKERARAIGIWAGMSGVGVGFGPVLGGLLLTGFFWGSVFFINIPIVIAGVILIYLNVPESRDPASPPIDTLGGLLSIVGLLCIFDYLIEAPQNGWGDPALLGILGIGIVLMGVFVMVEHRKKDPMLDVGLFRNMAFTSGVVTIMIGFFALLGLMYELTLYLQSVRGLSTLVAGFLLLPFGICLFIGAPKAPKLAARFGDRRLVVGAELLAAAGFILFSLLGTTHGIVIVVVGMSCVALGVAFIGPPASNAIMGSVAPEKAGQGSATNATMRQIGGSLGIALIGGIGQMVYASHLTASSAYTSLTGSAAATAKSSINGANSVASQMGSAGNSLHQAAADAFVSGMHAAMIIAFVATVAGALLAWLMIPVTSPTAQEDVAPAI